MKQCGEVMVTILVQYNGLLKLCGFCFILLEIAIEIENNLIITVL